MELTNRDKRTLAAGAAFLFLFSLVQFIWVPAKDKLGQIKNVYAAQDRAIEEMQQLSRDLKELTLDMDRQQALFAKRPASFTLFSFLDTQAQKAGVKKHVAYMKPFSQDTDRKDVQISKVKVKLKKVYAKGLVDFLSRIESGSHGVTITGLSLSKTGRKGQMLDAVIETQTLKFTEASLK